VASRRLITKDAIMTAFNVPPPWDPGFALPDNVRDEGLQRHAFVSDMLPRGTYDNVNPGTGGYNIPSYVQKEGTGRGTYTSKMAPRGSYAGPVVPAWLNKHPVQVQGNGRVAGVQTYIGLGSSDDLESSTQEIPEPYKSFGTKAARILIGGVSGIPASHRTSHLKAVMDHLDKSLWSRTAKISQRYQRQGMPLQQAFPAALARGLSTGLLAETMAYGTGKKTLKRRAPAPNSLIGVGCYGMGAMGDDAAPVTAPVSRAGALGASVLAKLVSAIKPCTPPPGLTWNGTAYVDSVWWQTPKAAPGCPDPATVPIQSANYTDPNTYFMLKMPDGSMPPMKIRAHNKTIAWKLVGTPPNSNPGGIIAVPTSTIGPDAKTWLKKVLTSGGGDFYAMSSIPDKVKLKYAGPLPGQAGPWNAQLAAILRPLGITPGTSINWSRLTGETALARAKHPTSGDDYILRLVLDRVSPTNTPDDGLPGAYNATVKSSTGIAQPASTSDQIQSMIHDSTVTNPLALWVEWVPRPQSFLSSVWDGLTWLATEFIAVISATLGAIGSLVCATMASPNAPAGAAVMGTAVGVPPQAAAGGANIARQACAPPVPAYLPPPDSGWGLPLLIAGGVAAVAILAGRKGKE
jgi:hypothetical protein